MFMLSECGICFVSHLLRSLSFHQQRAVVNGLNDNG